MHALLLDFTIQTVAGLVSVFVGVILALLVDGRRREKDDGLRESELRQDFERHLDTVLGSVVKNTAEAKRILGLLARQRDQHGLIHSGLETAVWQAAQDQFMALCRDIDERVQFGQFFDTVRQLQGYVDFRSTLLVASTTARVDHADGELCTLFAGVDRHLGELAEDVRFSGVLLITDHGKPVHKRIIGIQVSPPAAEAASPAPAAATAWSGAERRARKRTVGSPRSRRPS